MNKPKIGISMGDFNGVGIEIILKTLSDERILDICTPIIYGSAKVIAYHKNTVELESNPHLNPIKSAENAKEKAVNIVNVWQENVNITLGKPTEESGRYAFAALEEAVKELKMGFIDALVTAPIHKKAMEMASFPYPGHTEYITQALDVKNSLMLMISDEIKLGVVTGHVPVKEIANRITKEAVLAKINMLNDTLRIDFGYDRPRIAVLGLNPHAGDGGVIGKEEGEQIFPAIQEAKEKDILAFGPFSPDAFFATSAYKKFDGVLAMYHDQGLIPFKMIAFGEGVNYTAGLPFVRTSPDHGTAMDIAGMDKADETSFKKAIFWATDITRQRVNYMEMHLNPVQHIKLESEDAVAGREKSLLDG